MSVISFNSLNIPFLYLSLLSSFFCAASCCAFLLRCPLTIEDDSARRSSRPKSRARDCQSQRINFFYSWLQTLVFVVFSFVLQPSPSCFTLCFIFITMLNMEKPKKQQQEEKNLHKNMFIKLNYRFQQSRVQCTKNRRMFDDDTNESSKIVQTSSSLAR